MCANFEARDPKRIAEAFHAPKLAEGQGSFFPGQRIAAIRADGLVASLVWGLVPSWSKTAKPEYSTFNARSETVAQAPTFREPFKKRRCLLPLDSFFEWTKEKPKTRYRFAMPDDAPFAAAGVWDSWGRDESIIESCSMLTTGPNATLEPIHDRMPAILRRGDWALWLDPAATAADLMSVLVPYEGAMTATVAPR